MRSTVCILLAVLAAAGSIPERVVAATLDYRGRVLTSRQVARIDPAPDLVGALQKLAGPDSVQLIRGGRR